MEEGIEMDGSSFDLELVEFELDQQRRRKAEEAAVRSAKEPIRIPASAWMPLLVWMTATGTAMLYFSWT